RMVASWRGFVIASFSLRVADSFSSQSKECDYDLPPVHFYGSSKFFVGNAIKLDLTPALSSRRGRNVRRLLERSSDWICRTTFGKIRNATRCSLSWEERVRVRSSRITDSVLPFRDLYPIKNIEEAL